MAYEHSPEERLKRYKASLDKMAKEEGRNLKSTKDVPKKDQSNDKEIVNPVKVKSKKMQSRERQIKPPQELVSPAKKELGEAIATVRKSPKTSSKAKDKDLDGRNFLMLKVRLGSIESGLRDIKKRRETLEAQLKNKYIDRKKYQEEMTTLVAEGRKLLVEKERVEKEMKQLKPR